MYVCMCSVQYEEWFDVVEARVCGTDNWTDGLADIWRGNMHFTEHRVHTHVHVLSLTI